MLLHHHHSPFTPSTAFLLGLLLTLVCAASPPHPTDVCAMLQATGDATAAMCDQPPPRYRQPTSTDACVPTPPFPSDPNMANCGGSRPVGVPFATRSPVMGMNGIAATSQPMSSTVALNVLQAGGNAVDAAIAANAMEGVVEPMMNGVGGDAMVIVYINGTLYGLNSSGRASNSTSLEQYRELIARVRDDGYVPTSGGLPFTVPGAVKAWCMLSDRFGTKPLSELLQPAIDYAENGFVVTPIIASEWTIPSNNSEMTGGGRYPRAMDGWWETFTVVDPDTNERRPPRAGEVFKNPDLANTLRAIATGGCDAFYNGTIADAMDAFRAVGGTLQTKADFAAHYSEWVTPVSTTYRDRFEIFELPPNPQGIAALQQLNILEGFNLTQMGFNSADYLHVQVEAKKLAFADRAKYYADPDFVTVPVAGLLSKSYAAERRALINMSRAADVVDAGTPAQHAKALRHDSDTIYLTTADKDGNMVSLMQSNYFGFGSGLVVPGLGFPLQNRGALFSTLTDAADVYAPGKRPFHTIIPSFVKRDGKPWLSFGAMCGASQPQTQVQILCNLIDFGAQHGMDVQSAGDAARYTHTGSSQPMGEVMTDGGVVVLEAGVPASVRDELKRRGHHVVAGPSCSGYQGIMVETSFGHRVYSAGSDKRKDGHAVGY